MKFYLFENEVEWMKQYHPDLYKNLKDIIEVSYPLQRERHYQELQNKAHREMRKNHQDKLGALAVEYGYRVAANPEVSGVSNLGGGFDQVIFDETHNLSEVYDSGEPSFVAQKWLEHRRICGRTLLECLSGETH